MYTGELQVTLLWHKCTKSTKIIHAQLVFLQVVGNRLNGRMFTYLPQRCRSGNIVFKFKGNVSCEILIGETNTKGERSHAEVDDHWELNIC